MKVYESKAEYERQTGRSAEALRPYADGDTLTFIRRDRSKTADEPIIVDERKPVGNR